eukprot:TRINITY_DN91036_c0_g1_i1.p1 TRINITY_DN91036_c0_g1~~TRINITY_DN91036_c0_g1_i1.p1  ORF type:complete len:314 (-),score=54.32 TRINITY_DN91036_c0_g1_i1:65-1006(-)
MSKRMEPSPESVSPTKKAKNEKDASSNQNPKSLKLGHDDYKDGVIETLRILYRDGGMYERISQLDHALQCAHLAMTNGGDDETVVAALLHDVGWMLAARKSSSSPRKAEDGTEKIEFAENCLAAKLGILEHCKVNSNASDEQLLAQHDVIGATWLRMQGFTEKVPHLVEGHVLCKRYLTAKDPDYHKNLSADSKRTLVFQGGPMTPSEMEAAERDPLLEQCTQLRNWDDAAKIEGLEVPDFDSYVSLIKKAIVHPPRDAANCSTDAFYVRDGNTNVGVQKPRKTLTRMHQRRDAANCSVDACCVWDVHTIVVV